MVESLRIGAMISGGGRTLGNLADRIDDESLDAQIVVVIASNPAAAGVERARRRGHDVRIVRQRDFESEDAMHDAITRILARARVDLVCLCGYLRWLRVDPPLHGRVINIHPALLPEFGGRGMHGMSVHRAVLAAGRSVSGCSVHFVDEEYDHGPIILQRPCPVQAGDDEHTLAARVFEQECIAYPEAVQLYAAGRVRLERGRAVVRVHVDDPLPRHLQETLPMPIPAEDQPTPEALEITEEQSASLRGLIRQAKDAGIEPIRDEEEIIDLTRGEADELLEELRNLMDESPA